MDNEMADLSHFLEDCAPNFPRILAHAIGRTNPNSFD
jgi:hypothetical protein